MSISHYHYSEPCGGSLEEPTAFHYRAVRVRVPEPEKLEESWQKLNAQLGPEWDTGAWELIPGTKFYGVPKNLVIQVNDIVMQYI